MCRTIHPAHLTKVMRLTSTSFRGKTGFPKRKEPRSSPAVSGARSKIGRRVLALSRMNLLRVNQELLSIRDTDLVEYAGQMMTHRTV
jgi:hypothetical protein